MRIRTSRLAVSALFAAATAFFATSVMAQAGGPPQPYAPPPVPYYAPNQAPPAPYLHLLSWEERRLLEAGEIPGGRYISGGIVGSVSGFGIGHIVQGRYRDMGWVFTATEAVSLTAMVIGAARCVETYDEGEEDLCGRSGERLLLGGLIGFVAFRIYEVVDLWSGPPRHNRRVRAARAKAYGQVVRPRYGFYLVPASKGSGGVAGMTLRF